MLEMKVKVIAKIVIFQVLLIATSMFISGCSGGSGGIDPVIEPVIGPSLQSVFARDSINNGYFVSTVDRYGSGGFLFESIR